MSPILQCLRDQIQPIPAASRLVVGLSGGLDSVVLLHGLQALRQSGELQHSIAAIHINHGLQSLAPQWQEFCEQLCSLKNIPLTCREVSVATQGSVESAARESRYAAFSDLLESHDVLLLAHHLDDQLETFFLRLQRGAGVPALAGMPAERALGAGTLLRPMLPLTRADLQQYAKEENLSCVEDVSNTDTQFDRNFLRQELLPLLQTRWPNYRESWSKSIGLFEETGQVLEELAAQDLAEVSETNSSLQCAALSKLSTPRLRNLLRYWLRSQGLEEPGWNPLQSVTQQALSERNEGVLLEMAGYHLQLFADALHVVSKEWERNLPEDMELSLQPGLEVIHGSNGVLQLQSVVGSGISHSITSLNVKLRQGGEEIQLTGRPTKSLKKIFQENKVPPWIRERTPLLFADDELVCVPGIGVAAKWRARPEEEGIDVVWVPPQL